MQCNIQFSSVVLVPVAEFIAESFPTVFSAVFWPSVPLSRGYIHISSADPFQNPMITPRLLTDKFDQDIAVAMTRRSREVFSSPPFADVVANAYYDPPIAATGTDVEYLAWYKNTSFGASHWIGTTAMMPRALGGVVNPKLQYASFSVFPIHLFIFTGHMSHVLVLTDLPHRVYGTQKLRVVDAGILPLQVTSHPMPLLYAVAQKAASLITEKV